MTQADRIRQHVVDCHLAPAKARGQSEITIRAGDIHREMGLTRAMPAVCGAIGSNKFLELAGANLRERIGPANGANVYFRFEIRVQTALA